MYGWLPERQLVGLAAIGLACACGGQLAVQGADGGAQQDAAMEVDALDAAEGVPPDAVADESRDRAVVIDAGCSASVLTFEPTNASFAACWTCAKEGCSSQLDVCATDCACNDAIAKSLACTASGGGTIECSMSGLNSVGDPTLTATGACIERGYLQCGCLGELDGGPTPAPDAAPPRASDDASAACSPIGGNMTSGNGECDVAFGESCNGINYQVSCACPLGSCVCFGPASTRVVDFPGCPYCPSTPSIGPTTLAQAFELCGFPVAGGLP
jgi:hypothetical protein